MIIFVSSLFKGSCGIDIRAWLQLQKDKDFFDTFYELHNNNSDKKDSESK